MSCQGCTGITAEDPRFVELDAFIAGAWSMPGSLIAVLHKAQQLFGFLPQEVQNHVARALQLEPSEVSGVVSFYQCFNTEPVGRFPISVCMGTPCYVRGADRVLGALTSELGIKPGQVTADGMFSLEASRCIGECGLAPVISIAGTVYGNLSEHDVPRLLAEIRQQARESEEKVLVAVR